MSSARTRRAGRRARAADRRRGRRRGDPGWSSAARRFPESQAASATSRHQRAQHTATITHRVPHQCGTPCTRPRRLRTARARRAGPATGSTPGSKGSTTPGTIAPGAGVSCAIARVAESVARPIWAKAIAATIPTGCSTIQKRSIGALMAAPRSWRAPRGIGLSQRKRTRPTRSAVECRALTNH